MKYYYKPENRIIESLELGRKYGASTHIPQLGIYELTVQPNYIPVGFNPVNNKYYPVESYTSMRNKCIAALVASGMTEAEAISAIT